MTDAPVFGDGPYPVYNVVLVAANGDVVQRATAKVPPGLVVAGYGGFRPVAPLATSSNTRAYYLDGAYDIRYLTPDGNTGLVFTLPQDPNTRYAFAVSPEDKRMAVAAVTYGAGGSTDQPNTSLDLYIQDLSGANRLDLLKSTSVVEWPIGWHAGNLVVAVGPPGSPVSVAIQHDPYYALEYHVANATTGDRLAVFGQDARGAFGNGCNWGPLTAAGTACLFYDASQPSQPITKVTMSIQGWDGVKTDLTTQAVTSNDYASPLVSPAGDRLAVLGRSVPEQLILIAADGSIHPIAVQCEPQAWIDALRLICKSPGSTHWFVLDLDTLAQHLVEPEFTADSNTRFVGMVPQQMG